MAEQPLLVLDLSKAWSEAAREAAAAARRANKGDGEKKVSAETKPTSVGKGFTFEEDPGFHDGTGYQAKETEHSDGSRTVKLSIYDEGKAEGGDSTFKIKDGRVSLEDTTGSGPWGIPPGPDALLFPEGKKGVTLSEEEFANAVKDEQDQWKGYWTKQGGYKKGKK